MMKISSLIFLFSFQANATTALNSSPTDLETTNVSGSTVTLYAGRTDNAIRSSCSGSGTCNTCALDTAAISATSVCGFYEIIPTNSFSVTMTITGNTTLTSSAVAKICLDTSCTSSVTATGSSTYSSGSQLTITTTWGAICAAASTSNASCEGSFDKTFYIGYKESSASSLTEYVTAVVKFRYIVSANTAFQSFDCASPVTGEGFCYFRMYPGDQKAYIVPTFNPNNSTGVVADFTTASSGATDTSGMKYKYLRVLYVQGTSPTDNQAAHTAEFTQALSTAVNLNYDPTTGAVSPKKVTGLVNQSPTTGSAYLFTTASVDQAGLVTNYADTTATSTLCDGATYGDASQYVTMDTQCALPQRVSGLLDGQQCFIATASYGSIMAPEVETFRQFRNTILLQSKLGKLFVQTYYKYSPPMAEFIAQSEILRAFTRGLLLPLLIFVKISLWIGFLPTIIFSLFIFATLCSFIFRRRVQA